MDAADVALLRSLLDGLMRQADRLDERADEADKRWSTRTTAVVLGAHATGIITAVTAIRCAFPELAAIAAGKDLP